MSLQKRYWVYILKCADNSYYVGSTNDLFRRIAEHQNGLPKGSYTSSRLPVELVWSAEFGTHDEAFTQERRIKGWTRAKKEALMNGDWEGLHRIVKNELIRKRAKAKKKLL
jgi:predicted GIY-YIG superfamily endonuclease